MRDNLHEDLFADHAWGEMNRLLDREMPERKRRGAFWLWFLPALGLCVLLGRDSLLNPTIPVATEKQPVKEAPIARLDKQTVKNADQNKKTTPKEPTSASAKQASEDQPKVAIASLNIPVKSTGKSQASKNMRVAKALTLPTQQELLQKEPTATLLENPTQGNETKVVSLPTTEQATVNAELPIERLNTSQSIAQREMALTVPAATPETVTIKPQHARQKLEWWADAGTQLAAGVSGLSGYRMGISTGIPIGRLRLQTGLGYEHTEVGFQSVQRDVLTGKENYSAVKLANNDNTNLGSVANNTQSVSSIQLQFINWHLGLQYPLTRRLGLAVGGNVQYLESVKLGNQFVKESLFNNGNKADFAFANQGNQIGPQVPTESLSSASFRSIGYSAQAGLSYRVATRWSVMVDYRQSLQHFTKANNLLLKPQWLDFGLRYRIQ